jgi:carbon monoxide dehydrogenase subunit G
MTRIESDKQQVSKSADEIFKFLENFNNFEKLMPEQVKDWRSTEDSCSFTIAGMASLGMKIIEKRQPEFIKVAKDGAAPFDFNLDVNIKPLSENSSEVRLAFDADLNPMLKMMATKPLTNFLNLLVQRLPDVV